MTKCIVIFFIAFLASFFIVRLRISLRISDRMNGSLLCAKFIYFLFIFMLFYQIMTQRERKRVDHEFFDVSYIEKFSFQVFSEASN